MKKFLIILFLFIFYTIGLAKPHIALVLGGGSARGAAHIGILKQLEAYNIPVDVIIGTSMGSVVGGLYASGLSPQEIEQATYTIDWQALFVDQSERDKLSFRRKQEAKYFGVEIGINKKEISVSRGLIQGQKFNLTLRNLLGNKASITDFTKLNIPFYAIATDVETGETVVLNQGDLIHSIRASLSIPGAFEPIEINGRLLVDGGASDNVPIDIARQLGADIIIAVDVGSPLKPKEKLNTPLDIAFQVIDMLVIKNTEANIALLTEKDILLVPDLGTFSGSDFSEITKTILPGEEAVKKAHDKIVKLSVSDLAYQQYLAKQRRKNNILANENVIAIKIENESHISDQKILNYIKTPLNQPLDTQTLEKDIETLYGLEEFKFIEYRVESSTEGKTVIIHATGKHWGPHYLRFGFEVTTNLINDSEYNIFINHRLSNINGWSGEWRNQLQFGETFLLQSELYQPIAKNKFFISPSLSLYSDKMEIYDNNQIDEEVHIDTLTLGFDIGKSVQNWGEIRTGIYKRYIDQSNKFTQQGELVDQGDIYYLKTQFLYDNLDNLMFPKQGHKGHIIFQSARNDQSHIFDQLALFHTSAFSKNRHSLLLQINYQKTLRGYAALFDQFSLGGFHNLSAYEKGEFRNQNSALASIWYYQERNFIKNLPIFIGGGLEAGQAWQDSFEIEDTLYSANVFIGAKTFLGAMYLNHAVGKEGSLTYFAIRREF